MTSNVLIDPAEELRTLEYGQRLVGQARTVLASDDRLSVGARLFASVLAGGGQALGLGAPPLAVGQPLDLVSLNAAHPSLAGRRGDALLDSWIFAARGGLVDSVWRRGRKVVTEGRHLSKAAIVARYRQALVDVLAA